MNQIEGIEIDLMENIPVLQRTYSTTSNLHASSLTILNYTIGITIMFLPKYLIWSGVGLGFILLMFFACLNYLSCLTLVTCSR